MPRLPALVSSIVDREELSRKLMPLPIASVKVSRLSAELIKPMMVPDLRIRKPRAPVPVTSIYPAEVSADEPPAGVLVPTVT